MAVGKADPAMALLHCYLSDTKHRFYNTIPIILCLSVGKFYASLLLCDLVLYGGHKNAQQKVIRNKVL